MTKSDDWTPKSLRKLSAKDLARVTAELLDKRALMRRENQILYYRPASDIGAKLHTSTAHTIGMGGGNRSGKTEGCLVEAIALATGVFPFEFQAEFREKFKGPLNVRLCIESLTTVLHPIILPKLMWWRWTGIDQPGGERGHYGWVPRMCLKNGEWDKSWSEKLRTLTMLCRDPDDPERVLGESQLQIMCLRGDQRVRMADGTWREISGIRVDDLLRHPGGGSTRVTETFEYENVPLLSIRCRGGHEITATDNHLHPLVTGELKRSDNLRVGDVIRVNRDIDMACRKSMADWELGWCAIAIGDGCLRRRDFGFTATPGGRVLEDLPPLPPDTRLVQMPSAPKEWRIWRTGARRDNPLVVRLKGWNLWGCKSGDKFVPEEVFRQCWKGRGFFLRHLWNTDGTINKKGRQARYVSISRTLAFDVKYLLWGLGIRASTGETVGRCGFTGKMVRSFHTVVSGGSFDRFMAMLDGEKTEGVPTKKYGTPGQILSIATARRDKVFCLTVDAPDHLFIVDGLATHNSYDQDPSDYASGTFDIVIHDEPPPFAIWRENQARVLDVNGRLLLALTWPDDPSIPIDWIYDEVYEPGQPGPLKDPGIDWFELQTLDNRHIDAKIILDKTKGWSEETKKVRLKGQPLRFSNRIHPLFTDIEQTWCFTCGKNCIPDEKFCGCERQSVDLTPYVHVEDFEIGESWPCIFLLDPHPRKPHMFLWVAIDPSDDYHVVYEGELEGDAVDLKIYVDGPFCRCGQCGWYDLEEKENG